MQAITVERIKESQEIERKVSVLFLDYYSLHAFAYIQASLQLKSINVK